MAGYVAVVNRKGNKTVLTRLWFGGGFGLAWSPDGDEIIFAAATFGSTSSLYGVNRSGREHLIAHLPGQSFLLDVAPDGRVLLAHAVPSISLGYLPRRDSKEIDLYWHDLSQVRNIARDGTRILFSEGGDSVGDGQDFITYLRRTDGSPPVRLGSGMPVDISPDGKWAMVIGSPRAPSQLVLLPTGTGEARPLTNDTIHHVGAAWTPDGKRIIFAGNEPNHRVRYYVQSVAEGPPRAITPENINYDSSDPITISPDGRFVAVKSLSGEILLQPIDGGSLRPVPKLAEGFAPLQWCPDNSLLVYHSGDVPLKILRVDIQTGAQTLWKAWAPAYRTGLAGIGPLRVSADCQSSAYSAFYEPSELWIADGLH